MMSKLYKTRKLKTCFQGVDEAVSKHVAYLWVHDPKLVSVDIRDVDVDASYKMINGSSR